MDPDRDTMTWDDEIAILRAGSAALDAACAARLAKVQAEMAARPKYQAQPWDGRRDWACPACGAVCRLTPGGIIITMCHYCGERVSGARMELEYRGREEA